MGKPDAVAAWQAALANQGHRGEVLKADCVCDAPAAGDPVASRESEARRKTDLRATLDRLATGAALTNHGVLGQIRQALTAWLSVQDPTHVSQLTAAVAGFGLPPAWAADLIGRFHMLVAFLTAGATRELPAVCEDFRAAVRVAKPPS